MAISGMGDALGIHGTQKKGVAARAQVLRRQQQQGCVRLQLEQKLWGLSRRPVSVAGQQA